MDQASSCWRVHTGVYLEWDAASSENGRFNEINAYRQSRAHCRPPGGAHGRELRVGEERAVRLALEGVLP